MLGHHKPPEELQFMLGRFCLWNCTGKMNIIPENISSFVRIKDNNLLWMVICPVLREKKNFCLFIQPGNEMCFWFFFTGSE